MIIIPAIIINGGCSPQTVPNVNLGNHFDGENFIFFETEEEKQIFYNNLNNESDNGNS